ncbi:hypothetical protein [Streptomyces sp. NPDC050856]|uniref:hypothetical protein n=1 Tax=Streptomyces sp. NPDC050856 TaxID=3154939 RepID=UPI0033D4D523
MTNQHQGPDPDQREKDAAAAARDAEEERARAQPFSYPYPERRAGVRATRHITREQADADSVPGVPGGYGTTGGGQPAANDAGLGPGRPDTLDPAAYSDTVGAGEAAPGPGAGPGSEADED